MRCYAQLFVRTIAAVSLTTPLAAQKIMTSADLSSLSAPPPDARIAYGPGPLQYGNLRLPKTPGPHQVVVYIHGGCWLSEYNITHAAAAEQGIADAGYAVWSLEYRRVGDEGGGWPGTFADVARGADFLREIAPKYALDLRHVVAAGHSAGGEFALWLASRRKIPQTSELYAPDPLPVRGVLGLAPAPDLEGLHANGVCDHVIDKLMGGSPTDRPERYAVTSLMQLAPLPVPSVLVIGAHDQGWGPVGRSYLARALAAGDTAVHVVDAPEAGHFEIINPASSSWPLVTSALKELFARIGAAR